MLFMVRSSCSWPQAWSGLIGGGGMTRNRAGASPGLIAGLTAIAFETILWIILTSLKTNREITRDVLVPSADDRDYVSLFSGRSSGRTWPTRIIVTAASVAIASSSGPRPPTSWPGSGLRGGMHRYVGLQPADGPAAAPIVIIYPSSSSPSSSAC